MSETGIDWLDYYWVGMLIFFVVVVVMAFRFQSGYLKSLARQAEALERIAATLEKRA